MGRRVRVRSRIGVNPILKGKRVRVRSRSCVTYLVKLNLVGRSIAVTAEMPRGGIDVSSKPSMRDPKYAVDGDEELWAADLCEWEVKNVKKHIGFFHSKWDPNTYSSGNHT